MWLQRISAFAADEGAHDLLDEAARAMCVWAGTWGSALDHISAWLRTLTGQPALLLAAVLDDHPLCAEHFTNLVSRSDCDPRIRSAIKKAEHRRPL